MFARSTGLTPAIGLTLSLTISVFAASAQARALDPISPEEVAIRIQELTHEPWSGEVVLGGAGSSCRENKLRIDVRDPKSREVRSIPLTILKPSAKTKVPVVLVVPSVEGVTMIEPKIASQLCQAGIAAVISDVVDTSPPKTLPGGGHEDRQIRNGILALRSVLDLVSGQPAFDRDRVGIIGVSLGGIMTSLLAGLEPDRLRAVVVVVGGGNLPFILATSTNDRVSSLRRERMDNLKLRDADQYELWLRQNLRYDPLYFAGFALKDRIMMVTAKSDTTVPYSIQKDLYEAYGRPKISEYSGTHVETIFQVAFFYFDEVLSFYRSRFGMSFLTPPDYILH